MDRMTIVNKDGVKQYTIDEHNHVKDESVCRHEPDGKGRCVHCGRKLKSEGETHE